MHHKYTVTLCFFILSATNALKPNLFWSIICYNSFFGKPFAKVMLEPVYWKWFSRWKNVCYSTLTDATKSAGLFFTWVTATLSFVIAFAYASLHVTFPHWCTSKHSLCIEMSITDSEHTVTLCLWFHWFLNHCETMPFWCGA